MKKILIINLAICMLLGGCASMDQASRTMVGTQIGSLAGGILGAVIGSNSNRWDGAELGATFGSLAGGAVGAVVGATSVPQQKVEVPLAPNQETMLDTNAPNLVVDDIYLEDANGNQTIDAGEDCRLVFIIVNNGRQNAINVQPVVTVEKGASYIKLSPPVVISQISSEDRITYSVKAKASSKLPDGKALFSIKIYEQNGYGKDAETFTVATKGE